MSAGLYQHANVSSLMSAALCQQPYVSTFVVLSQQLLEQLRELCDNYSVPTDVQV